MSVWRVCPKHHQRYRSGERCHLCPPKRGKNPTAQKNFRTAVLGNAGNRCQWIDNATGERCPITAPLEAAHLDRYAETGIHDPQRGYALCHPHHVLFDRRLK